TWHSLDCRQTPTVISGRRLGCLADLRQESQDVRHHQVNPTDGPEVVEAGQGYKRGVGHRLGGLPGAGEVAVVFTDEEEAWRGHRRQSIRQADPLAPRLAGDERLGIV